LTLVAGIDEAGRGPVIGPLVLACVVIDESGKSKLRKLNVRDSKKVSPSRRSKLEPLVKKISVEWKLIKLKPSDIDRLRQKMSLNLIEAYKTAELITSLESTPDKIIVDATDNIAEDYKTRIIECIKTVKPRFKPPKIISEHKADDRYIEVSAASIIAKVERDRAIEVLWKKYGDFGSGYPSDEVTRGFLRELVKSGELPDFVRRSWSTVDKSKQSRLNEFE
jgi:ribonuclease HII